jgi:hypothetical protein
MKSGFGLADCVPHLDCNAIGAGVPENKKRRAVARLSFCASEDAC